MRPPSTTPLLLCLFLLQACGDRVGPLGWYDSRLAKRYHARTFFEADWRAGDAKARGEMLASLMDDQSKSFRRGKDVRALLGPNECYADYDDVPCYLVDLGSRTYELIFRVSHDLKGEVHSVGLSRSSISSAEVRRAQMRAAPQAAQTAGLGETRIIAAAKEIMKAARYANLVTIGDKGQPQARIVDPVWPSDDMTIWIATNPLTRKVEEIRRDGRVTLLYFNTSANEYVTVIGNATLATDTVAKIAHWKSDWAPFYKSGPRTADYVLIRIKPTRLEVVSPSRHVMSDPKTWRPAIVDLH